MRMIPSPVITALPCPNPRHAVGNRSLRVTPTDRDSADDVPYWLITQRDFAKV